MRQHLFKLRQSRLARAVLAVATGNSVAQGIVLLFIPIITRIYSPDAYGVQGVFLAGVSLLAPMVALRFPMAIVLAANDDEVRRIERLSYVTVTICSATLAAATALFRPQVVSLLGLEKVGGLILLLPVALMFVGLQEIQDYKAARNLRFRAMSFVTAIQALIVNTGRAVGGLMAPIGATLVAISTTGPAIHAGLLAWPWPRRARPSDPSQTRGVGLLATARSYRDFPLMRMPTDLLNAASQTLPVVILAAFFTPAIAGLYALARSVLNVPSNIVGTAIGKVVYADFAERGRKGEPLLSVAWRTTLVLLLGPGLLLILGSLLAPQIFAFAFGSEWREAGVYARWMSLWLAVALANVPTVRLAPVIGRQGVLLTANVLMLGARVGSILISYLVYRDPLPVVATYSVVSAVSNIALIACLLLLVRHHDLGNVGHSTRPRDEKPT